ncbi:hypothetical protein BUALT_Bualt08G0122100 [Buddleja alternifolia]|uniref:Uncharacterized protein n=1 Tax=Buddleja alternifolia TaxID=168488 RepID=A0AAV6X9M7_9LAMI|nr:hypothetical protein BUALT_Bualt08G0122100 [Buddleja alternifolia]
MAAAIGWYGPLIDLCKASSHVGDYVQLLVFVHKATPIQYKIARNGGEVVRMDILVGDETRSYFPVTIWQKQMGSEVLAGHVYLLQNVKITSFGDAVEARAIHCSSLQCLIRPNDFVASKGIDEMIRECRVGIPTREKLQKLVGWLQRARLAHCGSLLNYFEHGRQVKVNWKVHEEIRSQDCFSLSELCQFENSCKATFHASVGEIFLPITWINENEAERMFISRRLHILGENSLADDLITTGCQQCGAPLNARVGSTVEQNAVPLYCERSPDRFHVVGSIYRPFLLYVWDDLKYLPIFVTNKAAELLFGNISAEKVYSSYKSQRQKQLCCQNRVDENPNFYMIWLILLRMLFQHGKNSPLKFKVTVDTNRDWENGRLEMVSLSFPAFRRNSSA